MKRNQHKREYLSGKELLSSFNCTTREQKLELAIKALMKIMNNLHIECKGQDLSQNLGNHDISCSCADAYRMGYEALKRAMQNRRPSHAPSAVDNGSETA